MIFKILSFLQKTWFSFLATILEVKSVYAFFDILGNSDPNLFYLFLVGIPWFILCFGYFEIPIARYLTNAHYVTLATRESFPYVTYKIIPYIKDDDDGHGKRKFKETVHSLHFLLTPLRRIKVHASVV